MVAWSVFLLPLPGQQELRTLCRQEQADCQQLPQAADSGCWQQLCPSPAFHASGTVQLCSG